MMGKRNKDSCRKLFKGLEIFPFPSLYIYSLLQFVRKNMDQCTTNNDVHNINTRIQHNFHIPSVDLKKYQTGMFYMGIKIFNSLPTYMKNELTNSTKFLSLVKNFLCENSFYSLEE